jgi:hypothetical protein
MMFATLTAVFAAVHCNGHTAVIGRKSDKEGKREGANTISLLHRSALEKPSAKNPSPTGHMLTAFELNSTNSIACLQLRQTNPGADCSLLLKDTTYDWEGSGQLNAGNYPYWADPICHSNGQAYFCDPQNLLSSQDQADVMNFMKEQRASQYITCGPQVQHDPIDRWNYQPFYLGVAIADDWPLQETDSESLQSFGSILQGRWNMTFPWDGNPTFNARCPNSGILIILPKYRQAYFSSSSCMFICATKGGPEVATAAIGMFGTRGLLAGVKAGIQQVYSVLNQTSPMHAQLGWEPIENTSATWSGIPYGSSSVNQYSDSGTWIWNWAQRAMFVIACVALAGSVVMAIIVCVMAPGMNKELNKSMV